MKYYDMILERHPSAEAPQWRPNAGGTREHVNLEVVCTHLLRGKVPTRESFINVMITCHFFTGLAAVRADIPSAEAGLRNEGTTRERGIQHTRKVTKRALYWQFTVTMGRGGARADTHT